jgi:hypothetical protein
MAERAGMIPLVSAVPALFRHGNRSQEEPPPVPGERGFQRVSGRKLPSAFSQGMDSGGMSSPPPSMPLTATTASPAQDNIDNHTSFYRDSYGFYGGPGHHDASRDNSGATELDASPERGSPSPDGPVEIALSPGPRRTPTVHQGGPYVVQPSSSVPGTPVVGPRSATPNSRFAEDV